VQVARFAVRCTVHCAVLLLAVEIGARAASGLEPLDPEELTALGTAVGVQVLIAVLAAALLWLVAMGLARLAPAGDSVCGPELPSCLVVHAGAVPARRRRHTSYLGRAPPGAGILLSDQR
jgi:hypothetical protein